MLQRTNSRRKNLWDCLEFVFFLANMCLLFLNFPTVFPRFYTFFFMQEGFSSPNYPFQLSFFLPLSKLTNEIDYCIQDSGRRRSQDGNRRDGDSSVIVEKRPRLPSHVSAIISVLRERCNSLSPFWTTSCCLVASSRSSLEYEKPSKPSRFEQRSKNTRGEIIEDDEGRNYRRRRGKKLSKNKKTSLVHGKNVQCL